MELFGLPAWLGVWIFIFIEDWLRYFLAAGLLACGLRYFNNWADRRRIQQQRPSRKDRQREILHSSLTVLIFSITGLSLFFLDQLGYGQLYGGPAPGYRLLAEFALIVAAHDAYFYWMHRSLHRYRRLIRWHALHHRSRTPSPWTAYSFSAGEAALEAVFLPIYVLLLPMHGLTAFLFTSHMIIRNVLGHAGVEMYPKWWTRQPLTRWITTSTHHDLHHEQYRHNYGLYFTWWDRWMGTEHPHYQQRFLAAHGETSPELSSRHSSPPAPFTLAALLAVGLLFLAMPSAKAGQASADPYSGCWQDTLQSSYVEISPCGDKLCAVLSATANVSSTDGSARTDANNHQRRLRQRPLLGLRLAQLSDKETRSRWRGVLYRPDTGKLQRASFTLQNKNNIKIRACTGQRCQSLYWRRVGMEACKPAKR